MHTPYDLRSIEGALLDECGQPGVVVDEGGFIVRTVGLCRSRGGSRYDLSQVHNLEELPPHLYRALWDVLGRVIRSGSAAAIDIGGPSEPGEDGPWTLATGRRLDVPGTDRPLYLITLSHSGSSVSTRGVQDYRRHSDEDLCRVLVDTAQDFIMRFDGATRCLFANPAAIRSFNVASRDPAGRRLADLGYPADVVDVWSAQLAELFASGRERRFECSLGEHWYDIRLSPEFDGDVVRSVVSVARDITKQQRAIADLRESQRVYRAIGESIDYGVWVCAPDGRCIYASESFLKMVGITEQQCIDDGWINSLHPDDAEKTLAAWKECVRTGGTWDVEHRYRGADGAWHPVLARGVPVHDDDGRVVCWAGINLDIQQQKCVEEELRGVSDAKDRLLAILAHDLRGPMGSLATVLELVRAGELGFTDALRQAVAESSRNLYQLLEDVLIWTQTHTSRLDPTVTNIPVEGLLLEVSSLYELPASHKGVHLSVAPCPPSACVRGDLDMLRTVVRNLVGNAVKFTGRGGSVEVSARAIGARIEIRVHDTGVGVDTRTMASFPPGIPDSRIGTDRESRMGIGLAMSRDFVARNGGHLTFDSTPGLGTRVVVDLPAAPIGDSTSPDLSATLSRIKTQRFLLVEDDPLHREAAGAVLDGLSITWDHASDAVHAIAVVVRQRYDVVLLDINLPGVNGIELAHHLISRANPPPSLIALTAYRRDELEALTKSHPVPFHDTLRKPLDRAALVRSLAALPAVATGPGIDT